MLQYLLSVALLAGGSNYTRTEKGTVFQSVYDQASTWYLNVIFFEAVGAIVLGFLLMYWVFKKYGKQFTYE